MGFSTSYKTIFTDQLPAGVILAWSGSIATIPAGWQYCDGTNGTIDLRGLFIQCSSPLEGVGSTNPNPAHIHAISNAFTDIGYENVQVPGGTSIASGTDYGVDCIGIGHVHTIGQMDIQYTDGETARPPYYVLAYIQKL